MFCTSTFVHIRWKRSAYPSSSHAPIDPASTITLTGLSACRNRHVPGSLSKATRMPGCAGGCAARSSCADASAGASSRHATHHGFIAGAQHSIQARAWYPGVAMAVANRVFLPQDALDRWLTEGRVEVEGETMTLRPEGQSFKLKTAVRFMGEVAGGGDSH